MASLVLILMLFFDTFMCGYLLSKVRRLEKAFGSMANVQRDMSRDMARFDTDLTMSALHDAVDTLASGDE